MILLIAVGVSSWLLNWLNRAESEQRRTAAPSSDYYMTHFSTLTMGENGMPKNKLHADHMVHYPDADTTELLRPRLELFRENRPPILVAANQGWVMDDNQVVLLRGDVHFKKYKHTGEFEFDVATTEARIWVEQEYAETDKAATLTGRRSVVHSIGMKAYFQENRLEFIQHVHTVVDSATTN